MPVRLDANGRAVVWGATVEGADIPDPPRAIVDDPSKRAKWDGSQWVDDSAYDARAEYGGLGDIPDSLLEDYRNANDAATQRDLLFEMLTGEQP